MAVPNRINWHLIPAIITQLHILEDLLGDLRVNFSVTNGTVSQKCEVIGLYHFFHVGHVEGVLGLAEEEHVAFCVRIVVLSAVLKVALKLHVWQWRCHLSRALRAKSITPDFMG